MKAILKYVLLFVGFTSTATASLHAQVPVLNSYPSASATLFLDFDGQYVAGTSWNWSGPINAQPAALSTEGITEIFNRVAEDYRPFNLNITTDSTVYSAAPFNKRMRIIVTPTSSWYGSAGGVAYVGSFNWGNETPGWVFSTLLGNNIKYVAEACSHEAGHTLGLQHQSEFDVSCQKTAEYAGGQGSGEIGWAPIMGVGYYKNLTTWHNGPNTIGCSNYQNDLDIIAGPPNNFGFRTDDHNNDHSAASNITILGQSFLVSGLINNTTDMDAFKIVLPSTTNFKLSAVPNSVGAGNEGADIDIKVTILNANTDTVGRYNPSTLLNAGIDTNLNNGTYYLIIDGVGNANHSDYGSLGFYSLNGSLGTALPVHQFVLKGNTNNGNHLLNWSFVNDEPLINIIIESSIDGKNFTPIAAMNTSTNNFSWKPLQPVVHYRIKAITKADERAYYSNIIALKNRQDGKAVQLLATVVTHEINLNSNGRNHYELFDATGRLLSKGLLQNGINHIATGNTQKGMLFIRLNDGVLTWTEQLIKQ